MNQQYIYDIYKIGRCLRTIHDIGPHNSTLVDGPFNSYAVAAKQADHMNSTDPNGAAAPQYIAVKRKSEVKS